MKKTLSILCAVLACAWFCFSAFADAMPPMTLELDGTTIERPIDFYVLEEHENDPKSVVMENGGTIPAGSTIFLSDELFFDGETYGLIRQIDYADGRKVKIQAESYVRLEDLSNVVTAEPNTGMTADSAAIEETANVAQTALTTAAVDPVDTGIHIPVICFAAAVFLTLAAVIVLLCVKRKK